MKKAFTTWDDTDGERMEQSQTLRDSGWRFALSSLHLAQEEAMDCRVMTSFLGKHQGSGCGSWAPLPAIL